MKFIGYCLQKRSGSSKIIFNSLFSSFNYKKQVLVLLRLLSIPIKHLRHHQKNDRLSQLLKMFIKIRDRVTTNVAHFPTRTASVAVETTIEDRTGWKVQAVRQNSQATASTSREIFNKETLDQMWVNFSSILERKLLYVEKQFEAFCQFMNSKHLKNSS